MRFIDLQINGYAGVDFNGPELTLEAVERVCDALREDGVEGILATIISAPLPTLCARLAQLADFCDRDSRVGEMVKGVHLEGPFLSDVAGYAGAHPTAALRPADTDSMQALLDAARGLIRVVTLAPERDQKAKVTRYLADRKIIVSAGHCNATRDELREAIDSGLCMFTHLGNASPMLMPRHDNIIQRVLSLREHLYIGLIADGVHLPPFVLKNFLDLIGTERAFVVTDAMAAARLGSGRFTLGSEVVNIGEDLIAMSADGTHLMGSTATMPRMETLLREKIGLSDSQIAQLAYANPAKLLNAG